MKDKMDIKKIFAMLAQPKEKPAPLQNVDINIIEIPYITKLGVVESRPIRIYRPKCAQIPAPLIYIAHYEMGEDSEELRAYLKKGWVVASIAQFENKYNGQLTDDDLVFNNAALYYLRNLAEIDNDKIAVVGGSAGAYMSLMLDALQLGICCSIANGPIPNVYFNFYRYFQEAGRFNAAAFAKLTEDERKNIAANLLKLPLPFLGGVSGLFLPLLNNFPDTGDMARWEAFSPTALAEVFCQPILMNHFTSDVLVPVDQISRRFTYEKPGDSLPEDYCHRLPADIQGKLAYTLEERLPKADTRVECIPAFDANEDYIIPYDASKRFNINIFDEGPIEGFASHRVQIGSGHGDDIPYLDEMLSKTAAKTNILTTEKLRMFLERYQGKSIQLPAHQNIDDNVYGSLSIYKKEILSQLKKWKNDNGAAALETVFNDLIAAGKSADYKNDLQKTMTEINACLY